MWRFFLFCWCMTWRFPFPFCIQKANLPRSPPKKNAPPRTTIWIGAVEAEVAEACEGGNGQGVGRPAHADYQGASKTRLHGRNSQQVLRGHRRHQVKNYIKNNVLLSIVCGEQGLGVALAALSIDL